MSLKRIQAPACNGFYTRVWAPLKGSRGRFGHISHRLRGDVYSFRIEADRNGEREFLIHLLRYLPSKLLIVRSLHAAAAPLGVWRSSVNGRHFFFFAISNGQYSGEYISVTLPQTREDRC